MLLKYKVSVGSSGPELEFILVSFALSDQECLYSLNGLSIANVKVT